MASMEPDDSALDILSAASWPGVDPNDVLVEPHEVRPAVLLLAVAADA
jgi:hypothetical protein